MISLTNNLGKLSSRIWLTYCSQLSSDQWLECGGTGCPSVVVDSEKAVKISNLFVISRPNKLQKTEFHRENRVIFLTFLSLPAPARPCVVCLHATGSAAVYPITTVQNPTFRRSCGTGIEPELSFEGPGACVIMLGSLFSVTKSP